MAQTSIYWATIKPRVRETAVKLKKKAQIGGHTYYDASMVLRDDDIKLNKRISGKG